jgi:hypothetical protein
MLASAEAGGPQTRGKPTRFCSGLVRRVALGSTPKFPTPRLKPNLVEGFFAGINPQASTEDGTELLLHCGEISLASVSLELPSVRIL